ncbi:MAG: cache domain-containing protein [Arcobacteraceae bacterium]
MKTKANENNILKFLKFSPPIITVFFSALIITLVYLVNQYTFNQEIANLKDEFSRTNKEVVKNEVDKVHAFIVHQKEQTEKLLKKSIRENVNIAHVLINEIYLQNQHKDKDSIKQIIKKSLQDLRFNSGIGYFFIISQEGEMIFHPYLPELENTNVLETQDPNGSYLFKNMITLIHEQKEAFCEWYWFKPDEKIKKDKKIGYIKNIEGLNWIIGSGYYVDDFENILKEDLFEYTPKISFGQNGYVFIIDYEGNMLSNKHAHIIGKNVLNDQDKSGKYFVKEMINIAQKGNGYVNYYDPTLPKEKTYIKTSFVKGVPDWNFLIGAGFNENELNEKIIEKKALLNKANDEYIINMLIISLIITLILTVIASYISKIIQNQFIQYKNKISKEIRKNHEKDMFIAQQSKMNALGDMIGNIAHQWRQPLSTITTASSGLLLKQEFETLQADDLISFTKIIDENAQYLSKTIEEFKEFFEQKKVKMNFKIESAVQKAINIISSQFTQHQIQIITQIKDAEIYGIENELMQTVINIMNNSHEAFDALKIEKKFIFVNIYPRKDKICLEIKDNANGIKESILNRIFEPYFSTKFKSQGTGIGLYMCYEIITKHFNGTIKVENCEYVYEKQKYAGAKFTIILPLKETK